MMTIMTMMLCIGVDDDGNDYGYGYHGDNEDEVDEDDDENIWSTLGKNKGPDSWLLPSITIGHIHMFVPIREKF